MTRDAAIESLRAHEASLRRQGVQRAALFGSTARGEATSDSDFDFLVQIDRSAQVDLYRYVGITQYIAELFAVPVDVADHTMLIEPVRRTAERDAVYASEVSPTKERLAKSEIAAREGLPIGPTFIPELRDVVGRIAELIDLFGAADSILVRTLDAPLSRAALGLGV